MKRCFIILAIMVFYSCEPTPRKLLIINNTEDSIFYLLKIDTNLSLEDNNEIESKIKIPPKGSDRPVYVFGDDESWNEKIYSKSVDSTLHIYIFNTNYINDTIIKNRKYKRYDFKVKQLDSLKWNVTIK